jgi:hypothetical protein
MDTSVVSDQPAEYSFMSTIMDPVPQMNNSLHAEEVKEE